MKLCAASLFVGAAMAAPILDLVSTLPGFEAAPFKVYSGYLTVPGPVAGYDQLKIHYQFHESQGDPSTDPIATWHQGGPGGSSMYGLYAEMGYFQTDDQGTHTNDFAWNKVASMLYLESPAGSGGDAGFSECHMGGAVVGCQWDDVNQGEAYAKTLYAFKVAFPEYADNDLYLTGESYAGQYIPNIAHYIVNDANYSKTLNLKGIAVGNGCWGGDANTVNCNGPNAEQNAVDRYFGKGLVSRKLYNQVYATCKFPNISHRCDNLLEDVSDQVGPHNIYDIYDNCPQTSLWLEKSGKSMRWLRNYLWAQMSSGPEQMLSVHEDLKALAGGYDWSCGGMIAEADYVTRDDVMSALHISNPGSSSFRYETSGPASVTLYPELVSKIRVMIFNGDSDDCVPYKGNEEWIDALEASGNIKQNKAWTPWYVRTDESKGTVPSGYATTYTVPNSTTDFSFVTIRLAGHMVPTFQPAAGLELITRFFAGEF